MRKQFDNVNRDESLRIRHAQKAERLDGKSASLQGAVLVSRIAYALLIVGFMGYYLDKALEIIKQP